MASDSTDRSRTAALYDRLVLGRPKTVILLLLAVFAALGYYARYFRLDASADSILLEHDPDLLYYRTISARYQTNDFLLLAYTPTDDLFSDRALADLRRLRDELRQLARVSSVITILDAPLLRCPPVPLAELKRNLKHLEWPTVDRAEAKTELAASPIFGDLLLSPDQRTTGLVINLQRDEAFEELLRRRNALLSKEANGALSDAEAAELATVRTQYRAQRDRLAQERHADIAAVRAVMATHRDAARLFLGGLPMVTDDMISFVQRDLQVFGVGVFCFLVLTLGFIFRSARWVVLPMLCCAFSALSMIGLLGLFRWEVTVISSNFISLQLVMTMALAIHLAVRYQELLAAQPAAEQRVLVRETVRSLIKPCLYTSLTTIAGFYSLLFCGILPVINFGWMMTVGLVVSMLVTFLLFPAGLVLLRKSDSRAGGSLAGVVTAWFARVTESRGRVILALSLATVLLTVLGISRLTVENCFINYFRESTEIYQGMKLIDERLGGTTPLDVIVRFEEGGEAPKAAAPPAADEFAEFAEFEETQTNEKYWFTADRVALVAKVHDYLDRLPETGKVLSLATVAKVVAQLSDERPFDSFDLALLFKELPQQIKDLLVTPYVSVPDNEVRLNVRIRDSLKSLRRQALLQKIQAGVANELRGKRCELRLTGTMVLYNNMLQSLFRSQIRTIGFTVLAILIMFLVLFRSVKVALIAIVPNILSSLVVLGAMGLLGLPLDMMTITVVAISVGLAVDNTIHYVHRFRHEFPRDRHYGRTMYRCHGGIGNALYYTTLTVAVGFSILIFSQFIPCVLFGLFTGLAVAIALVAALTLLPRLILLLKPFGPDAAT